MGAGEDQGQGNGLASEVDGARAGCVLSFKDCEKLEVFISLFYLFIFFDGVYILVGQLPRTILSISLL